MHPHVNPILRIADSPEIEHMVLAHDIEIGVTNRSSFNAKLTSESLCSENVVAIVSSRNPIAKKGHLSSEELSQIPIIVRDKGTIYKQLQEMGVKLNIAMRCEPIEALKAAVSSGLGLGFFHRNIVENEIKRGYFKIIKVPHLQKVQVTWFIQYANSPPLSREANDFRLLLHRATSKVRTVKDRTLRLN
jgi:DNA-binding transcriptional LysR family regulator